MVRYYVWSAVDKTKLQTRQQRFFCNLWRVVLLHKAIKITAAPYCSRKRHAMCFCFLTSEYQPCTLCLIFNSCIFQLWDFVRHFPDPNCTFGALCVITFQATKLYCHHTSHQRYKQTERLQMDRRIWAYSARTRVEFEFWHFLKCIKFLSLSAELTKFNYFLPNPGIVNK